MLLPGVLFLAVFFIAPLYYIVRFSLGLSHLSATPAIAQLQGEATSLTLDLWRLLFNGSVTLHVLGVHIGLSLPALAIILVLVVVAAIWGSRLGDRGTLVTVGALVLLIAPFLTIPAGNTLIRVAKLDAHSQYLNLFFKSVSMAMTTSCFAVVIAFPVAYYLAVIAGRSRTTWLFVVIAPFLTSFFLRVVAWKVILGANGLVNETLYSLGLRAHGHAVSFLLYSQFTVIVVLVYAWAPFAVLPMYVALQSLDQRAHEAAADLGASRLQIFRKITLPLAAPGLVAGFLFVFIPTIGEFVTPSLVGGVQGYMFGNEISDQFVVAINWQTGSALALFLLAVVLVLTAVTSRFLRAEVAGA